MNQQEPYSLVNLEAVRNHFHQACQSHTPVRLWHAVADIPVLLAELSRLRSLLALVRASTQTFSPPPAPPSPPPETARRTRCTTCATNSTRMTNSRPITFTPLNFSRSHTPKPSMTRTANRTANDTAPRE